MIILTGQSFSRKVQHCTETICVNCFFTLAIWLFFLLFLSQCKTPFVIVIQTMRATYTVSSKTCWTFFKTYVCDMFSNSSFDILFTYQFIVATFFQFGSFVTNRLAQLVSFTSVASIPNLLNRFLTFTLN